MPLQRELVTNDYGAHANQQETPFRSERYLCLPASTVDRFQSSSKDEMMRMLGEWLAR